MSDVWNAGDLLHSMLYTLQAKLAGARSIGRSATTGDATEAAVRDLLADCLPVSFGVAKGFAVSANASRSPEMDVLICDRLNWPVLPIPDAGTIAVPAPGVLAAAEIKSSLDRTQLKAAMEHLAALRKLPDYHRGKLTSPPLAPKCYVIAFESEWSSVKAAERVFLELIGEQQDDHLRINGLVLLDKNAMIVRRAATVTARTSSGNVIGDFLAALISALSVHGRCPAKNLAPFVNVVYPPDHNDSSG